MEFKRLDRSEVNWDKLSSFEDRVVYQTREWMEFVADTQRATPVIAALQDGPTTVGYFSGFVFRRAGIRILASPFPGWTTPSMGFNLLPGVARWHALQALEKFAFQELKCLHIEVSDQYARAEDGIKLGFSCVVYDCIYTDLTPSEQELFASLKRHSRTTIRKGADNGVRIEEAHDEEFADDYYDQLKDVFARQKLVPTYNRDRVRRLIRHLSPTGRLLLLRARDREGRCIATGIFAATGKAAEYWGSASFGSTLHMKPNDVLAWYAICYWKRQGMHRLSWGPRNGFKEKWVVTSVAMPWFRKSRFALIGGFRQCAKNIFDLKQRLLGNLHRYRELREKAD